MGMLKQNHSVEHRQYSVHRVSLSFWPLDALDCRCTDIDSIHKCTYSNMYDCTL